LSSPLRHFHRLRERESLRPDLGRGVRCMIAFMVPLGLAFAGKLPVDVLFAALTAQNIALVDVRGGYALRLTLLAAMTAVMVGAAALGSVTTHPLQAALAATLLVALASGLWRHLSSDYGPSLATASSLIFFIALAIPASHGTVAGHALAALIGGAWGVILQVALWPIRPQHPLRVTVADSWLAAADIYSALADPEPRMLEARHALLGEREGALRASLDKAYATLATVPRSRPLVPRLDELTRAAGRLTMRVMALNSAREALAAEPGFAALAPSFQPLLVSLGNNARAIAVTVVSRQPGHLAGSDVRRERLSNLVRALRARLQAQAGASPAWEQVSEILQQIEDYLPLVGAALRATVERADERAAFSLELADLSAVTLRPLVAALNLSWSVDWTLIRYTLRIAVLTLAGVAFMKTRHLAHGYWLPFTMVVVLQPDYGSTRQKAAQRLLGTLAGSILASLTLWMDLPFAAIMAAVAATSFIFGYYLKRNYGLAVVFITLFVVLLTEANGPVTLALTAERVGSTVAGGGLALLAALVFWPVWERDRFRPILAKGLRANIPYLQVIASRLASGGPYDREVGAAKQRVEAANAQAFSSLQRMSGDPKNRRELLQQAAALANGNQRLTRSLSLLALHLKPGATVPEAELPEFSARATAALSAVADAIEDPAGAQGCLASGRAALDSLRLPLAEGSGSTDGPGPVHHRWVFDQFARAGTELSAMLLAVETLPRPSLAKGPSSVL
jgi:uncharacterized membrane protein YccC